VIALCETTSSSVTGRYFSTLSQVQARGKRCRRSSSSGQPRQLACDRMTVPRGQQETHHGRLSSRTDAGLSALAALPLPLASEAAILSTST
jgi:hypothetical protein